MNDILKIIFSLSLSGSLLILVLSLCKPLIKDTISKQWQYYIYLVVIARLLLPFTPRVSLTGTLLQQADQAIAQMAAGLTSEEHGPVTGDARVFAPLSDDGTVSALLSNDIAASDKDNSGNATPSADERPSSAAVSVRKVTVLFQYLWLIWMGGALSLLIRKTTVYQSFTDYIKAGSEKVSDIRQLDQLARLGTEIGVKRPVELSVNRLISSPLLLGFFRPCIVLPDADLPDMDFEYTLRHELTHCRRRDLLYKWLVQVTICLHWFNPLVWLMGREINRACELSCDEAIIRTLDAERRHAYGDTLLHAMGAGGSLKNSPAALTLSESSELLKERLKAIMEFKKIRS